MPLPPRFISTSCPLSYMGAVPSDVSPIGSETHLGPFPCRGLTTQVSAPKSISAYITALKKKPDNQGVAPYLLSMRHIIFHTIFARAKFLTTSGQSLSVA